MGPAGPGLWEEDAQPRMAVTFSLTPVCRQLLTSCVSWESSMPLCVCVVFPQRHKCAINISSRVFHTRISMSQTLHSIACSLQPPDRHCSDAHFADGETEVQTVSGVRQQGAELGHHPALSAYCDVSPGEAEGPTSARSRHRLDAENKCHLCKDFEGRIPGLRTKRWSPEAGGPPKAPPTPTCD